LLERTNANPDTKVFGLNYLETVETTGRRDGCICCPPRIVSPPPIFPQKVRKIYGGDQTMLNIEHLAYKHKGVVYEPHEVNKLTKWRSEKLEHFITKSLLFYILRSMKHDVITEFEISGCGVGDVLDLTTSTQYEIESEAKPHVVKEKLNWYLRNNVDIVFIDLRKVPNNLGERFKYLKELVRG
jgi:hypothetical protein